jgi:protein O-mannosyl-transferase
VNERLYRNVTTYRAMAAKVDEMPDGTTTISKTYHGIVVILLLAAVVLALYWPVTGYDFIALDDNLYLFENPDIQKGLSRQGISWALTTLYTTNWHPLTWLSLMADYELYGFSAAGYHFTSILLHLLNVLLLFLVLRRMTGETGKSLTVTALFAVHPLNIESVAWIAERKNLLSTLFWILTLFAYIRYAERPGWQRYLQALFLFALGLMAKPMLVTMPFILFLLDYWPLRRFSPVNRGDEEEPSSHPVGNWSILRPLLKEKIPFFLLSICSVLITVYAAKIGGMVESIADFPLSGRIVNALVVYETYLEKMIWPVDLAIFYPYPKGRPVWQFVMALLFLTVLTAFALFKGRKHPYLVTGWFWYLITLLPVIGIIQVGFQSMANRYVYVPLIGIFVLMAWGIPEFLKTQRNRRVLPIAAVVLILIFSFSTWAQLPHWRNSEAAFQHAVNVTEDNFIAQCGIGEIWQRRGVFEIARLHYQEALRIKPGYAQVYNNLAVILMQEGKIQEAEAGFREALKYKSDLADAHNNLGAALILQKKFKEGAAHYAKALELNPGHASAKGNYEKLVKDGNVGIHE